MFSLPHRSKSNNTLSRISLSLLCQSLSLSLSSFSPLNPEKKKPNCP